MDLKRDIWYVRWFFWSLDIWDAFLDRDTTYYINKYGTNLCFFIRTMLVWAPLVLILHTIVYGVAIAALTIIPIYLFGGSGYFWGVGAIVTLALIIFGVKALNNLKRSNQRRRVALIHRPIDEVVATYNVPEGPSFLKILWEWLVAQKKKICPTITFSKQREV